MRSRYGACSTEPRLSEESSSGRLRRTLAGALASRGRLADTARPSIPLTTALALVALTWLADSALATSMLHRNLVDLIEISDRIVVADVQSVQDGFDAGVPYTEITLQVEEGILGAKPGPLSFRQFGLTEPRAMPNGTTNLNVSPDGWPRFTDGEKVLLFLHDPGASTGLQTTVGLMQGKFTIREGRIANAVQNQGLFANMGVAPDLLNESESKMLDSSKGELDAEAFVGLVRKAVRGRWVQQRRMHHE